MVARLSQHVVTHRRGGVGRKQNAAAAWALAGAPAATQCLKGFISLAEGQSPQRHRARREAQCRPLPAGKVHKAFSFSPVFLFHARKRKVRGASQAQPARGVVPRIPTPNPDSAFRPIVSSKSKVNAFCSSALPIASSIASNRLFCGKERKTTSDSIPRRGRCSRTPSPPAPRPGRPARSPPAFSPRRSEGQADPG